MAIDNGIQPFIIIEALDSQNPDDGLDISIAIPILNEEENIPLLYAEIIQVMDGLDHHYEIIFVDDGSSDQSFAQVSALRQRDNRVKIIRFSRTFGQTAALSAAFQFARGEVVITMDGDLQNDPADIPRLLAKMAEGYDLVNGWRKNRHDAYLTRILPSQAANIIINFLISGTHVHLHDFGCTLKAYKHGVVKNISLYGEMHRFVPVFAAWLGAKITEIPVNHRPRRFGVAKYNLSRVVRVILDLVVIRFFGDFLTRPIQFFGKIAIYTFLLGGCFLTGLLVVDRLAGWHVISWGVLLILVALFGFFSLQMVFLGLLAEINVRSYFQNQGKNPFIVKQVLASKTTT